MTVEAKKCLVTGGAGFIGSHLVDRLLDEGHEVVVLDNFSTGRPENLAHQRGSARLKVQQADIADPAVIRPWFNDVDWVFHIAALADIVPSIQRPLDYHRLNVDGTVSVLEAARAAGVKRFLYAASSSCYGIPDTYPTAESADIRPQYPYALSKYLGECCVMHWGLVYGLPVVCLRLFNVYGPRLRTSGTYGAVFGVFLAKVGGKTVHGRGRRDPDACDFTFVSDVVNAFVTAAESDVSGEIMNVGSGDTYSVNLLVELLGGEVTYIPRRPGEPDCTFADTAKIRRLLGWQPRVDFDRGVAIMLENIDYWRQAPVWTPEGIAVATKEWFECLRRQS